MGVLAVVALLGSAYGGDDSAGAEGDEAAPTASESGPVESPARSEPPEETLPGLSAAAAVQVDSGSNFACAVMAGRVVRCWGTNSSGQLGAGPVEEVSLVPIAVSAIG